MSRRSTIVALALLTLVCGARIAVAQTNPPSAVPKADPPIRRWFEIQQFTIFSRYRFIENSSYVTTANQLQYKDSFRARVNLDAEKRYTINVGAFTGTNFIGTWNNWGVGTGGAFVGKQYVKQLFASATPVKGLELQYGGLYVIRGELDDWTSYDEDGFLMGERVSVRRPKELYLDEVSVTRGMMGPYTTPAVTARWDGLGSPNYWQVLGQKRFNARVAGSIDYTTQSGADTLRAAVTIRLPKTAPISTFRYEQYKRVNAHPAAGFAVWAERPATKFARVQGGYISVDRYYLPWNADRALTGNRVFVIGTVPIYGPLASSIYYTHAFDTGFPVTLKNRFDAVISYDVLDTLRKFRLF